MASGEQQKNTANEGTGAQSQYCCCPSGEGMLSLRSLFRWLPSASVGAAAADAPKEAPKEMPKNGVHTTQPHTNGKPMAKEESDTSVCSDGMSEAEVMRWRASDYEKELVKRTWSDDFDFLYELGSAIYTYIFERNPHTKELFPNIHRHGAAWRESGEFRAQALRFVQTLSYAAKNLYHMEECLEPYLADIGERHVKYAPRGFRPEHWNIFLDAMEHALTAHIAGLRDFSEQQRADATRVWRRLAHYIIAHMKRGYSEGEAQMRG